MCERYLFISEQKLENYIDSKDKEITLTISKIIPNFIGKIKEINRELVFMKIELVSAKARII